MAECANSRFCDVVLPIEGEASIGWQGTITVIDGATRLRAPGHRGYLTGAH